MKNRIAALLAGAGLATLIACVGTTDPGRSPNCRHPGDTTGYAPLIQPDSVIVACIFLVEPETSRVRCFLKPVELFGTKDCVAGEKWKGYPDE